MCAFYSFMLFLKYLIRLSTHGWECVVKLIFWHKWWWWCSNSQGLSKRSDVLNVSVSCVCGGIKFDDHIFLGDCRFLCFSLKIGVLLKIGELFRSFTSKNSFTLYGSVTLMIFLLAYIRSTLPRHLAIF